MSQADIRIISHPSIRVKGTENEFDPINCNDTQCSIKIFHMHCPFCVKTEFYQDSRILKAHYHVKHVDKGIEFGGLKVLRCCKRCDIVGVIKEEKKFKGAHWHCFICKNGFNRRDEAMKHYRTHFRHSCTTLQIHVPQEVNKAMAMEDKKGPKRDETKSASIHLLSEAVITSTTPFLPGGSGTVILRNGEESKDIFYENEDQNTSVTTTSEHLVHSTDNQPDIVIIQEDQIARSSHNSSLMQSINSSEEQDIENKWQLGKLVTHLQDQLDQLQADKDRMEKSLNSEIEHLKAQVQRQTEELELLRRKKDESSIEATSNSKLQQIVSNLQQQHSEMLHQHMQQVKQELYQSTVKEIQQGSSIATTVNSRNNSSSTTTSNDQTVVVVFIDNTTGLVSQTLPISLSSAAQAPAMTSPSVTDSQVLPISIPLSLQSTFLSDSLTMPNLGTSRSNALSSISSNSAILDSGDCPVQSSKHGNSSSLYNPCLPTIQQLISGITVNNAKSEQTPSDKLLIAIPSTLLSTPVSATSRQNTTTIPSNQDVLTSIDSAIISTESNTSTPNSFVAACSSSFANCPTVYCSSEVTNFDSNTSYIITEGDKSCALQVTATNGNLPYSELISLQTAEKRKINTSNEISTEKRKK